MESELLKAFSSISESERRGFLAALIEQCDPSDAQYLLNRLAPQTRNFDLLQSLPAEIALIILSFLDASSLNSATRTSRYWNTLCADEHLYKLLCFRLGLQLRGSKSWKARFIKETLLKRNWKQGTCKAGLLKSAETVRSMYLNFDETRAISVYDSNHPGHVWNLPSGDRLGVLRGHGGMISTVKFNDKIIVSGSADRTVKVWCSKTGACLNTMVGHENEISCLQFNEDHIISGGEDNAIIMWDIRDGTIARRFDGHEAPVTCLQFDKNKILSGSLDKTLRLWRLQDSSSPLTLRGHEGDVYCLQYEGDCLISGSADNTLRIWNLKNQTCTKVLRGHDAGVLCLQFDDRKIVSGSVDFTIKVWDRNLGNCLYTLKGHQGAIWNIRFNKTKILSSSLDHTLRVWDFDTDEGNTLSNI